MKRREYLAAGGIVWTVSTAGCLGWFGSQTESDGNEVEEDTEAVDEELDRDTDQDEGDDADATRDDSTEHADEREDSGNDGNEDDELAPDREDVEPDRDAYDDPEERDVIERDPTDVTVDVSARDEDGLIDMTGAVTNVSDEFIDAVDLDFEFYDSGEEYVGGQLVTVQEIEPGEAASFEVEFGADELHGEFAEARLVSVSVYGFPDHG